MCFTSGLNKIEEQRFSHKQIKSNLIESAIFKQISEYSTTVIEKSDRKNRNIKKIFCLNNVKDTENKEETFEVKRESSISFCNRILKTNSCNSKTNKKEFCVDTIISMNNAVYFSLVFFLGAFINNKGIIKIGTL